MRLRDLPCAIEEARLAELPQPDENELAMLDLAAAEVRPNSRLSCQIKPSARIGGLAVHLPMTQG